MSSIPRYTAVVSALSLVPLLIWNATPATFPQHAHDLLASVPLAGVGLACLLQPFLRHAPRSDLVKALLAAAAFFAWAGNQRWPDHPQALVMNDVAVALFVVDVMLGIRAAPAGTLQHRGGP